MQKTWHLDKYRSHVDGEFGCLFEKMRVCLVKVSMGLVRLIDMIDNGGKLNTNIITNLWFSTHSEDVMGISSINQAKTANTQPNHDR